MIYSEGKLLMNKYTDLDKSYYVSLVKMVNLAGFCF